MTLAALGVMLEHHVRAAALPRDCNIDRTMGEAAPVHSDSVVLHDPEALTVPPRELAGQRSYLAFGSDCRRDQPVSL